MNDRHRHKEVQNIVYHLLETIPETRQSYERLYIEYIRHIDADAVDRPFKTVITNLSYPSFQSIARASRSIKHKYPWLKETDSNTEARAEIEAGYYYEYGKR